MMKAHVAGGVGIATTSESNEPVPLGNPLAEIEVTYLDEAGLKALSLNKLATCVLEYRDFCPARRVYYFRPELFAKGYLI
jgi:hypothetical protein